MGYYFFQCFPGRTSRFRLWNSMKTPGPTRGCLLGGRRAPAGMGPAPCWGDRRPLLTPGGGWQTRPGPARRSHLPLEGRLGNPGYRPAAKKGHVCWGVCGRVCGVCVVGRVCGCVRLWIWVCQRLGTFGRYFPQFRPLVFRRRAVRA